MPGTRVLQFAFDGDPDNVFLPENYVSNTVVYTGTHDNPPTRNWFEELPDDQQQNVWKYLKRPAGDSHMVVPALMESAWSSVAALSVAPLQDLLNLGKEGRMNVPGSPDGNWRWRSTDQMFSDQSFEWLRDLTKKSNRLPARAGAVTG
jgi:4-alpha-glucanotransferase